MLVNGWPARWPAEGMTGLGADLVKDPQSGGLTVTGRRRSSTSSSGARGVGRASSTHRSSGGAPPPPPPPDNPIPDYGKPTQFRKGAVLAPDTTRIDAGTGEGPYNPSNPLDRLRAQVNQAAYSLWRRSNPTATTPPSDIVSPIVNPLTAGGGGGGGGGGGDTSSDTQPDTGFWAGLSTAAKVGVVAAGLAVVGGGIYFFTRKRGGGAAPSHKS